MINPLIPMGAVTGSMTRSEIREMMEAYKANGLDQYLFYARGGCTVEFMSDEWLDICENIVLEAERLGIAVWLYDEYDCPSGTCARTITKDFPEYECQGLRKGKIVSNWAYINMADLLNPDCVTEFINRTYEKLYARLKPYFGTVIKGIFSDEPSMGCTLRNVVETHPYSKGMELEYHEACGRDLFEDMKNESPDCLELYYKLLGARLKRTYMDRIRVWCAERGVLFTGHLLEEQSIRNAVNTSGDLLNVLRGFSLPGMDEIRNNIGFDMDTEWLTLGTICAARSRYGALAELGAFGPCDNPIARDLQMVRLAALFGVDHYVLAVSGCDSRGSLVKTDWLHPTNYTQPYFECFREYGEKAKQCAVLANKQMAAEVAVEYPADEAARSIALTRDPVGEKLNALLKALTVLQYQWVIVAKDEKTPDGAVRIKYDADIDKLTSVLTPAVRCVTADGALAYNVLVRRYTDGTVCVLDMADKGKKQQLILEYADGKRSVFTLWPRDLHVSTCPRSEYALIGTLPTPEKGAIDRPNTSRCVFTPECLEYRFSVKEPLEACLYLRSFGVSHSVTLDGKAIAAVKPCSGLQKGLRELYSESEKLNLCAGTHTVCISDFPGRSESFLPSVFIAGMFGDNGELYPADKLNSEALNGFAGCAAYEFEADLLEVSPLCIEINANEASVELSIEGEILGKRVAAPYMFRVPDKYLNSHVHMRVRLFTTVGPLFGNRDEVLSGKPKEGVLYTYFPGRYTKTGLEQINLYKEV